METFKEQVAVVIKLVTEHPETAIELQNKSNQQQQQETSSSQQHAGQQQPAETPLTSPTTARKVSSTEVAMAAAELTGSKEQIVVDQQQQQPVQQLEVSVIFCFPLPLPRYCPQPLVSDCSVLFCYVAHLASVSFRPALSRTLPRRLSRPKPSPTPPCRPRRRRV